MSSVGRTKQREFRQCPKSPELASHGPAYIYSTLALNAKLRRSPVPRNGSAPCNSQPGKM